MRGISILIPCIFLLFNACHQRKSTETVENVEENAKRTMAVVYDNAEVQAEMSDADSAALFSVDQVVRSIEKARKELPQENLRPNVYSEDDHLFLSYEGNQVKQVVLTLQPGESRERSYFFFDDDQLHFYRKLEWHPDIEEPFARELIVFFREDEIFNVEERRSELKGGVGPNILLNMKFTRSVINKPALKKAIEADWARTRRLIEENSVNFSFDK